MVLPPHTTPTLRPSTNDADPVISTTDKLEHRITPQSVITAVKIQNRGTTVNVKVSQVDAEVELDLLHERLQQIALEQIAASGSSVSSLYGRRYTV